MRILQLRFKNLNSLYGEWHIDFTVPEYVADGIFAITGSTGAGKSTLLDAICLALYGCTPRLDKITKNSNEIMSRHTAECFAEVIFATQAGTFCCFWEQHRAHRKIDGGLVEATHEISEVNDALTRNILENKKLLVAKCVEEKTGMDFHRFTRSMLLAQGGFAAFLQANADDRAPILEQLTGTEIYSDISKQVHLRLRDEREKLTQLEQQCQGVKLLDTEVELDYRNKQHLKQQALASHTQRYDECQQAINWRQHMDALASKLAKLEQQERAAQQALTDFAPEQYRLKRALNAQQLAAEYAALLSQRQQLAQTQQQFDQLMTQTLPTYQSTVDTHQQALVQAQSMLERQKNDYQQELVILRKIRQWDTQLQEKHLQVSDIEKQCKESQQQIDELQAQQKQLLSEQQSYQQQWEQAQTYLQTNQSDAALTKALSGITTSISLWEDKLTHAQQIEKQYQALEESSNQQAIQHQQSIVSHAKIAVKYDEANQLLITTQAQLRDLLEDKLLRDYRNEQEYLLQELDFIQNTKQLYQECDQFENELNKLNTATIPQQQRLLARQEDSLQEANQALQMCKTQYMDELAVIKQVRQLDILLETTEQKIKELEQENCNNLHEKSEFLKKMNDFSHEKQEIKNSFITVEHYLTEHTQDASLLTDLTGIKTKIGMWQTYVEQHAQHYEQIVAAKQQLQAEQQHLQTVQMLYIEQRKSHSAAIKQQNKSEQRLQALLAGKLLREYRYQYETLLKERDYLRTISRLEQERDHLEEGKPCPLCGAKEHPFAVGHVPVVSEVEKQIQSLAQQLQTIEGAQQQLDQDKQETQAANMQLLQAETALKTAQNQFQTYQQQLTNLEQQQQTMQEKNASDYQQLLKQLAPFGIRAISSHGIEKVLSDLTLRSDTWQAQQLKKNQLDKQLSQLDMSIQQSKKQYEQTDVLQQKQQALLAQQQQLLQDKYQERQTLYGSKIADEQEIKWQKNVKNAEDDYKKAENQRIEAQQLLNQLQQSQRHLQENIERILAKIGRNNQDFYLKCERLGFIERYPFADSASITRESLPDIAQTKAQLTQIKARIAQLEAVEQQIVERKEQITDVHQQLVKAETDVQTWHDRCQNNQQQLGRLKQQWQQYEEQAEQEREALLAQLNPFAIDAIHSTTSASVLKALQQRANEWQAQQEKQQMIDKQLNALQLQQQHNTVRLQDKTLLQQKTQQQRQQQQQSLQQLTEQRIALYGEKNPDTQEQLLVTALDTAQQAQQQAQQQFEQVDKALHSIMMELDKLTERLNTQQQAVTQMEQAFTVRLRELDFQDEDTFLHCRLSQEVHEQLQQQERDLIDHQRASKALREDSQQYLHQEQSKQLSPLALDELMTEQQQLQKIMATLHDELGAIKQKLRDNQTARDHYQTQWLAVQAQQAVYQQWSALHDLIGSGDGKRYRNFAQGLTFEVMVAHANQQLKKMTDRYLLSRDPQEPLDLNVIDQYQAGEVRSTKNLSGGESFIVSMALALGLSSMSSRKVRVDSLFLDEGFGTLDNETLETALDALAGLNQEGKLIGVISHVVALKERISTQIRVHKQSGGRSRLSGVGVM